MVTDHAHIIALNKFTGALLWETEMADWHQNYNATGAPLPVGSLVVTGTSGGDEGVRGFVAAFDQVTGREVWRAKIPYANTATPMTYRTRSGRQFIVMAIGTGADNALVAFALAGV